MEKGIQEGNSNHQNISNNLGEEAIHKIPSLALKRWCPTHWLGHDACLKTLCGALEYILGHLRAIQQDKSYDKKARELAAKLYTDLTNYEDFVFFFYYQEITARMAHTARLLQYPDLQLFDITRYITLLHTHLQKKYAKDSRHPVELMANGYADQIIKDLFNGDINEIRSSTITGPCGISRISLV